MVEACLEIFEFGFHCEWSNFQTMIIELGIALPLAGIVARYFFKRERNEPASTETNVSNLKEISLKLSDSISQQQKILDEMYEVINEQKMELHYRKESLIRLLNTSLNELKFNLNILEGEKRYKSSNDEGAKYAFDNIERELESLSSNFIDRVDLNMPLRDDLNPTYLVIREFFIRNHLNFDESELPSKYHLVQKINEFQEKYVNS